MSKKKKLIFSIGSKGLLGMIVGFFLALFMSPQESNFDGLVSGLSSWFYAYCFVIYGVVSLITIIVIVLSYAKGKKLFLEVDDDGEYINKDNYYLFTYTVTSNFLMVFSFAMFGIVYSYLFNNQSIEDNQLIVYAIYMMVVFVINIYISVKADFNIISLVQQKEPMLKTVSDPSSFKFSNEYFSRLDEAQKQHQALSAFKASKMLIMINFVFFVAVVFLNLIFGNYNQSVVILAVVVFVSYLVHQLCAFEK